MKGLLFSPEMARAVCAGTKTMTRRVVVPQPPHAEFTRFKEYTYRPGERVAMLATWAVDVGRDSIKPTAIRSLDYSQLPFWHAGMTKHKPLCNVPNLGKSRPGRFLPNHLRPLMPLLEIVSVKCERVQEITEADAKSEGCDGNCQVGYIPAHQAGPCSYHFAQLWDSINGERGYGWAVNPWCFCYTFKVVTPSRDRPHK